MTPKPKKGMTEFIVTCVVAVIVLGGAVFQAWKKMKTVQNAEVNDSLRRAAENELKDLQNQQLAKQSHLLEKSDSIIRDNQRVIHHQEETLKNVVGYGFPIIVAGYNNERKLKLLIKSSTGYPLRNLGINVVDWSDGLLAKMDRDELKRSDVKPNQKILPHNPILTGGESQTLPIVFELNKIKALELKINTEHASFVIYMLCQYEKEGDNVRYWYKTFETDRQTRAFKLIDTNSDESIDNYFKKYFYQALLYPRRYLAFCCQVRSIVHNS